MNRSRREFVRNTAILSAATGSLLAAGRAAVADEAAEPTVANRSYVMYAIGVVERTDQATRIRVFEKYADGLLGLDQWSHVNVFYWFDKNDSVEKRGVLQVHPRGDANNPLTGVFACRAPVRPNLIALTVCKILAVEKNVLTVDQIDAFDGTPVIDLKPLIPPDVNHRDIRVPEWAGSRDRRSTS
jgi:tRNA-Thr(GGU) m(6)t(6)A37 methyltransferase TsaA